MTGAENVQRFKKNDKIKEHHTNTHKQNEIKQNTTRKKGTPSK